MLIQVMLCFLGKVEGVSRGIAVMVTLLLGHIGMRDSQISLSCNCNLLTLEIKNALFAFFRWNCILEMNVELNLFRIIVVVG